MAKVAFIIVAAAIPLVVLAFWPLYLSRPFASVDRFTHLHAAAGASWLCLLVAQPAAIHFRRFYAHRILGWVSYPLAAGFAIAAVLLSHHRLASMDEATFAAEGYTHYLPFYATLVFLTAYGLGLFFRRTPAAHGRFMLCTAIPLIDPVLGRVMAFYLPPLSNSWFYQVITFGVATIVAGLIVFTYRGPKLSRWALIGYFALLVFLEIGWFVISPTRPWLEAVRWFRGFSVT